MQIHYSGTGALVALALLSALAGSRLAVQAGSAVALFAHRMRPVARPPALTAWRWLGLIVGPAILMPAPGSWPWLAAAALLAEIAGELLPLPSALRRGDGWDTVRRPALGSAAAAAVVIVWALVELALLRHFVSGLALGVSIAGIAALRAPLYRRALRRGIVLAPVRLRPLAYRWWGWASAATAADRGDRARTARRL